MRSSLHRFNAENDAAFSLNYIDNRSTKRQTAPKKQKYKQETKKLSE